MEKQKIDYNSAENQRIKSKFVSREVYCCFSYEMEAVLQASMNNPQNKDYPLPTYEDIENLYTYRCPQCGEERSTIEAFRADELSKRHLREDYNYFCDWCNEFFDTEPELELQEIFEYWIVSEYLYRKLKEKDEPVLEWGNK